MMTSVLVGLLLAQLHYGFDQGVRLDYGSTVVFNGFIPVLGGYEGEVVVDMGLAVDGLDRTDPNEQRAANEITSFNIKFNGAKLPLETSDVQTYFPRTTISLLPDGKITKTDAPDIALPVRLPGLDVKRFPDITYVPVQFPTGDLAVGATWSYKKKFGDSEVDYDCTLKGLEGDKATIGVSISQDYELLEDSALQVVKDEQDAENRVKTKMTGTGTVVFDTKDGYVVSADMTTDAVSDVTHIVDGTKSQRDLKTTFKLVLKTPQSPPKPKDGGWLDHAWQTVSTTASVLWENARSSWAALKVAISLLPWLGGRPR